MRTAFMCQFAFISLKTVGLSTLVTLALLFCQP